MKTSLVIDDKIFHEAKKEADETGTTISQVISRWAQAGREALRRAEKDKPARTFRPRKLGNPKIDLSSRKNWMEELERDSD